MNPMIEKQARLAMMAQAIACVAAALVAASAATATDRQRNGTRTQGEPASTRAGVLMRSTIAARSKPSPSAPVVKVLKQFRSDFRTTTLLVVGETKSAGGTRWLRVSLPLRPNGTTAWVPASSLQTWPVHRRIVVDLSARTLRVLERGKIRLTTRVAIGRRAMETPRGRFFVTAAFRPKERFYGVWALETSAYSKLSEWPGGGFIGIHGTTLPGLLGQAVSHGCIRVSNNAARALKRLVRPGTPVQVVK
jgi:lipoprotein-anchoring transpeptidase ErfK/SrfK